MAFADSLENIWKKLSQDKFILKVLIREKSHKCMKERRRAKEYANIPRKSSFI